MEPWRAKLDEGDSEAAWDLFIDGYRRLIFATIKQLARDHDDILDVFARVCEALRANDLARLRRYTEDSARKARFTTWLVAVVRNQAIDWLRQRDGRRRPSIPTTLSPLQQEIFAHVSNGRSYVEAYELIRARAGLPMRFGTFLKEVTAMYHVLGWTLPSVRREPAAPAPIVEIADSSDDPFQMAEAGERIAKALATLPPDERLAVQLFVVDEMAAADIARTVGWRNAKAVYNRVYRALAALRDVFERQGIRRDDL